ncbi:MAG: thiol-disulfide oxidoreductase DCC family protein [Candidatus Neomarinimicrobiota bacterium]
MKSKTVIYYDGICILCSSVMSTLIKMDKDNILYFSPLQSNFAKSTLDNKYLETMGTVIVKNDEKIYTKSNAAFIILEQLKNPLRYLLYLVPSFFTDFIYDFVAKRRYSWFGKKEECIFPLNNPKFLID